MVRAAQGHCEEAEAALEQFVAARPHHWGARTSVADCFTRRGDTTEARRIRTAALAVEPHLEDLLADAAAQRRATHPTTLEETSPKE